MRAVVVDDSSAMRAFLKLVLTKAGFEVSGAPNGRAGLELLHSGTPPDLVLLDWNMPEMDGFQMLCTMRADAQFRATRVMMVTTETELGEMSRALEAGADEYVMKPFTPEMIFDKLQILGLAPQTL